MIPRTGDTSKLLEAIAQDVKDEFKTQKYILSFDEYVDLFLKNPKKLSRNSAEYIKDMIESYGIEETKNEDGETIRRFKLFERHRTHSKPPIVGQEHAHEHIYRVIEQFVRQGRVDKLILLHGPNGSSKSSTAEMLAQAFEEYCLTEDGAVYRFNWVFPTDKVGYDGLGEAQVSKAIGFGEFSGQTSKHKSFAHLSDNELLCKIVSEMKENPIFLIPKTERAQLFMSAVRNATQKENVEVPHHIIEGALGAKSKKIFDALLVAYMGDLKKVLSHIQVERFFYSARYRTGISFVEPQMAIDAQEKQLTMDRNIQNIPPVLQNIRIYEPTGELIDANRGFIEFSDLLKRPVDAFKYLLTTIEKMSVNLYSGAADLDLVMIASANEKHLDAFKAAPDWASFKGRFELVRVPYLLSSKLESKIYDEDVKIIQKTKPIGPHTIELLAVWGTLTRLKQPDEDQYDSVLRSLVSRLDPFDKLALYDEDELSDSYSDSEKNALRKLLPRIKKDSQSSIAYEGRFGASPRELKMLLYFASQNTTRDAVSALGVFEEIEKILRDRSVFDFLQFEPRAGYHDCVEFLKYIQMRYAGDFYREFLNALNLFDETQYAKALNNYLRHVVAYVKKEKVKNDLTGNFEEPNEKLMDDLEQLMGLDEADKRVKREQVVGKIASFRVDNPSKELDIRKVFHTELQTVSQSIYEDKLPLIEKVRDGMLRWNSEDFEKLSDDIKGKCNDTFDNLSTRFGYTRHTAWESLVFLRGVNQSGGGIVAN